MKSVLMFKAESEEYTSAFHSGGYRPVFVEPLQFIFTNLLHLKEKLQCPKYDGMILTSPRAVAAVARVWDASVFNSWTTKKIYTVGSSSASKIESQLRLEASGADTGSSRAVADLVIRENHEGAKFLFPCGNLTSETILETLCRANVAVDPLMVYETKENECLKHKLMEVSESRPTPCCMVFFSPSGCEFVHRHLQDFPNALNALPRFAIGDTTAQKIISLGIPVAGVADKPEPLYLLQTVNQYFASANLFQASP